MGRISTKELLDRYYDSVKGMPYEKTRSQIDKPELYDYEERIGKNLIDMTGEDLVGLFVEFGNKRKGKEIQHLTATNSVDQLKTQLVLIFEYYSDTIERIKNPFTQFVT